MIEEMTILASDAAEPTKDRALARPGIGNSLFSVQTGEDFKGVDVIGTRRRYYDVHRIL